MTRIEYNLVIYGFMTLITCSLVGLLLTREFKEFVNGLFSSEDKKNEIAVGNQKILEQYAILFDLNEVADRKIFEEAPKSPVKSLKFDWILDSPKLINLEMTIRPVGCFA